MVNILLGGGPILLGLVILGTELLKWPRWIHFISAGIAILFGLILLF